MSMNRKLSCFLSYPHSDRHFVKDVLMPILKEKNFEVWLDNNSINAGSSVYENVIKGIRQADVIIAIYSHRSTWFAFELGAAIAQDKPIVGILTKNRPRPSRFLPIDYIYYVETEQEMFREHLEISLSSLANSLIDAQQLRFYPNQKLIGIKAGTDRPDFQNELRFTSELIGLLKQVTRSESIQLVNTSKGSFKSLISLDLKSWAELAEKVFFFIPELKKRKSERLKIDAEVGKLRADTLDTLADIRRKDSAHEMQEKIDELEYAERMIELIFKFQRLGVEVQFADELYVTVNEKGIMEFKLPRLLKDNDF